MTRCTGFISQKRGTGTAILHNNGKGQGKDIETGILGLEESLRYVGQGAGDIDSSRVRCGRKCGSDSSRDFLGTS